MHMLVWHVLWPLNLSLRVLESSAKILQRSVNCHCHYIANAAPGRHISNVVEDEYHFVLNI